MLKVSKMDLKNHVRTFPDFPKPGILFYDISTLLKNKDAWKETVNQMANLIRPNQPDVVFGIEARGFLIAAPVAYALGCGFAMVRKREKLPGELFSHTYALEYGEDTLEIQPDAASIGDNVVIVDDLLATGGTLEAAIQLLSKLDVNICGAACIIELIDLKGKENINFPVNSLISY